MQILVQKIWKQIPLIFMLLFLLPKSGWSQEHAQEHQEKNWTDTVQVHSIQELFSKGELHGHVRNYFMATWNHQELSNHYANAFGAEIGIRTASLHGLSLGISGLFTYNLFSSNLVEKDLLAKKQPVTERELFDLQDPENKHDLDRLESAYIAYNSEMIQAKIGRFSFNSPLINPQDTRMKPYTVQGVEVQLPLHQHAHLVFAWLDHFSPRSIVEWGKAKNTIGIYQMGYTTGGVPSTYAHHLKTKGVAIGGLVYESPQHKLQAQGWNYWIQNISNSSYGCLVLPANEHLQVGVEGLYQFQVGNGGHHNPDTTYFQDQRQWLAGAMINYNLDKAKISLNYLHTGNDGRFTFPREWGREQFFATLPRGRLEGTGATDLLAVKASKEWASGFTSELALARAWLPAISDFTHNKYGLISYWSPIADLTYQPKYRALQGVKFRILYVVKASPGDEIPLEQMFYNTNYNQINFTTQVKF